MKRLFNIISGLVLISFISGFAQTKENNSEASKFKFGLVERFRIVNWDNAITLSEAADAGNSFTRIRTSLFGIWMPSENWELQLKLTNEFRSYFVPQKEFDMNEIFVDQFYAKYKGAWGAVTLGRQNIILGEGFVVMDGHPLDGSRSVYFNAARMDLNISKSDQITLFCSYVPDQDDLLPIINDYEQKLIEQPEIGAGAYYNGNIGKVNLQGYGIFKKTDEGDNHLAESNIYTLGARVKMPLDSKFDLTAEAAYQTGDMEDYARSAFGGYAYLTYKTGFKQSYLPLDFTLGGIYLSGDDPTTEDVEGWDPLFSRWPKWSESYIYTLVVENKGKVAYWSNFASIYAKLNFEFVQGLKFNFDYHHMFAPEESAPGTFPGGTGSSRGDLLIGKLVYNINKNLTGHLLWEHFEPGDYYFDDADSYNWVRMELLLSL